MVVQLVHCYGPKKWTQIAKKLNGRIGKQCRERWHNHLDPNINKSPWTEEEDRLLAQAHEQYGNQWAKIAKLLPGRYCHEKAISIFWREPTIRHTGRQDPCVFLPFDTFPYSCPLSLVSFRFSPSFFLFSSLSIAFV